MEVTLLKQQSKNRYEVVFDNNKKIVCSEELVLKYRLIKGKEIKETTFNLILEEVSLYNFLDKAIKYLEKGLKSSYKIYLYLLSKDCDSESAKKIVEILNEKKLLDDTSYFMSLADYYSRKGYGPYYIRKKAQEEHLEDPMVGNVLQTILEQTYLDECKKLCLKQSRNYSKEKDSFKLKIKLSNYLKNRGFDYNTINRALEEYDL